MLDKDWLVIFLFCFIFSPNFFLFLQAVALQRSTDDAKELPSNEQELVVQNSPPRKVEQEEEDGSFQSYTMVRSI